MEHTLNGRCSICRVGSTSYAPVMFAKVNGMQICYDCLGPVRDTLNRAFEQIGDKAAPFGDAGAAGEE
jgi:hypothetical protein